jgi:deoxycytidine triphosphate deaminase
MGLLSDSDIGRRMYQDDVPVEQRLKITRGGSLINADKIGESSVNLHLSSDYRRLKRPWKFADLFRLALFWRLVPVLDLATTTAASISDWVGPVVTMDPAKGLIISPREVLLAMTEEFVEQPADLAGLLLGRQSYARLGLQITLGANFMVAGHFGKIPLQIFNASANKFVCIPGSPSVNWPF